MIYTRLFSQFVWSCISACLHVCVCASEILIFFFPVFFTLRCFYLYVNLCISLEVPSLMLSVMFSACSLSHQFFSHSISACLFFSADVLTDRVIALGADPWTRHDTMLHYELMLKLGRISGIHPYASHLIIQGGGEMCLWT